MDIRKAGIIKCSADVAADCLTCESCILKRKLSFAAEWAPRVAEAKKQSFIRELVQQCNSVTMISSLLGILQPLQHKDFIYAKSKANPTYDRDLVSVMNVSNKSITSEAVEVYMAEDKAWFSSASFWAKLNYLLSILKRCNSFTIDNITSFLAKHYESERKHIINTNNGQRRDRSNAGISIYTHGDNDKISLNTPVDSVAGHKQSVSSFELSDVQSHQLLSPMSNYNNDQSLDGLDNLSSFDDAFALRSMPISQASSYSRPPQSYGRLSARCYPFVKEKLQLRQRSKAELSDSEYYMSCGIEECEDYISEQGIDSNLHNALSKQRDFIRRLPVYISKSILGYLDFQSLVNCVCVSRHWRFLAEEVKNELRAQHIKKDDVMLIQGSTENIPNPVYARIIQIHRPKIGEDGNVILNDQAKHVDVTCEVEDFEDQNMQDCYDGIETVTVDLQARNVFCGAYNVLVLNNVKDASRVTFYNGGQYVPVASVDRRIRLLDVKSGKCEKTIVEHVGSVKSVCTDEARGFVLSGSYDTTVRFWNIASGRCQRIFLGHKSSVISLSLSKRYLATGSTDKTCKVWNLKTGKCIRTFRHRNIIHSVSIGETLLLSGCAGGMVRVWDFKKAKLIKSLDGHFGPITCTQFDDYHIATGSKDCYAMVWSAFGTYNRCLQTFRHSKEVTCLEMMYGRIVTGSVDGKIRVWNLLNGECLRIIRGNSRNDPITALYASEHRLIINTKSSLLLYNFEAVEWDFTAPAARVSDFIKKTLAVTGENRKHSNSFSRAQSARRKGAELKSSRLLTVSPRSSDNFERGKRVQSAPTRKVDSQGIQRHILRIQSAVTARRQASKQEGNSTMELTNTTSYQVIETRTRKGHGGDRQSTDNQVNIAWGAMSDNRLTSEKSEILSHGDPADLKMARPRVIARSRSAPAHRVRSLPADERGLTSSSEVNVKVWESKLTYKASKSKPKLRPFSATVTAMKHPVDEHSDLKLKTFYQQLQFESALAGTR